jgi:hypothetical protein
VAIRAMSKTSLDMTSPHQRLNPELIVGNKRKSYFKK